MQLLLAWHLKLPGGSGLGEPWRCTNASSRHTRAGKVMAMHDVR